MLGIYHQWSLPDLQYTNTLAEKFLDTLGAGIQAILLQSNLPIEFWGLAALYLVDFCPTPPSRTRFPSRSTLEEGQTRHGSGPLGVVQQCSEKQSTLSITKSRLVPVVSLESLLDWVSHKARKHGLCTSHLSTASSPLGTLLLSSSQCGPESLWKV
eukprot:2821787-Rhodomonas_salina.1